MPDQLEGRELDRAVAVALGWRNVHLSRVTGPVGDYFGIPPGGDMNIVVPRFESEFGAHTQDELDWLHETGGPGSRVDIRAWSDGVCVALSGRPSVSEMVTGCQQSPEGIARLIVAVAEAEESK